MPTKSEPVVPDEAPVAAPPVVPPVTEPTISLDDWAQSASHRVGRRVEGLNAYYRQAQRDGLGRATPASFDAAFAAFLSQPA